MQKYLIRRLLLLFPVMIGVSLTIFMIMRIVPGDVAASILLGDQGQEELTSSVSREQFELAYQDLREELGLNKPLLFDVTDPGRGSQYFSWLFNFFRGNWGNSLESDSPITSELKTRVPITLQLGIMAILISLLIGIPAGIISALRQDTWIDYVTRVLSISGLAMPVFWTSTLILMLMVIQFHWSPPVGFKQIWQDPWLNIQQVIWPAMALGAATAAIKARYTRSMVLEVLRQDYVRTAQAKGLTQRVVIIRHVLKNSLAPVLTVVGVQFAHIFGGTVILEVFWGLPGMGTALIQAVNFRDYPLVQTLLMIFAINIVLVNLLVDLMYAWMDPRIRLA